MSISSNTVKAFRCTRSTKRGLRAGLVAEGSSLCQRPVLFSDIPENTPVPWTQITQTCANSNRGTRPTTGLCAIRSLDLSQLPEQAMELHLELRRSQIDLVDFDSIQDLETTTGT
jgi:hypothetical protein